MPGRRRPQVEPDVVTPNALVASAARMDLSKKPKGAVQADWQAEAWDFYDTCGELRYAANWMGNSLSRATIYAADVDADGQPTGTPTQNPRALAAAHDLLGGPSNQAQILQQVGVHLTIAGDAYIIGETPVDQQGIPLPDDEWYVASTDELSFRTGGWFIDRGNGRRPLAEDRTVIIRVWNSHPRKKWQADSPVRAVLPVLRELRQLQRVSGQQMDSRLAGAGLLILPIGVQFPEPTLDSRLANPGVDPLMLSLAENIMVPLEDPEDSSRLVPMTLRVPPEAVDKVKLVTFASQLWAENTTLREACIRRLALGLDMPAEALLGTASLNHWCSDESTEALTINGWRRHDEINVGDMVRTLNHETGLAEWAPVLDIYRADVVDEPMRSMERGGHSSLTTAAHRWPVLRTVQRDHVTSQAATFVTTDELRERDAVITAAPSADCPTDAKHADALVELVAWYWTEGNHGTSLTIAQSHTVNPGRVARIRRALTVLYGPAKDGRAVRGVPSWRESVQPNLNSHGGPVTVFHINGAAAEPLHAAAPGKRVTPEFIRSLTAAQLELFIDVSCQGDGWHYRSGKLDIWQKDPAALDAFELALILSGRMVTRYASGNGTCVNAYQRTTVRPTKGVNGLARPTVVPYTGTVWCPTTPNGTWLARRNGTAYYTGNSAWQVEESGVKLHVVPVLTTVVNAINSGYYEPALERQGLDAFRFTLWFDTSELVQRPNHGADAQWLYEHDQLSGEALRRETGFDDSDAPTTDEKLAKILATVVLTNPDLLNSLTGPLLRLWAGGPASADDITIPPDTGPAGEPPASGAPVPTGTDIPTQAAALRRGHHRGLAQEAMLTAATEIQQTAPDLASPEIVCAHLLTNRALELAGKRLLTREIRGTYDGDLRRLHEQMKVTPAMLDRLLSGAWDWVEEIACLVDLDGPCLRTELADYVGSLLTSGQRHEVAYLTAVVSKTRTRARGAA
jgi:hypothetical protein